MMLPITNQIEVFLTYTAASVELMKLMKLIAAATSEFIELLLIDLIN